MITLLLFVAPVTASTSVDWRSMIRAGTVSSARFPTQDEKCESSSIRTIFPPETATRTFALFGQELAVPSYVPSRKRSGKRGPPVTTAIPQPMAAVQTSAQRIAMGNNNRVI